MRQPCGIQDFAKSPVSSIGFIELLAGSGGNLPMPPLPVTIPVKEIPYKGHFIYRILFFTKGEAMNRDEAKTEIKGKLEEYLIEKGINPKNLFHCLNPEHNDKHPSMSYDPKRNRVHCFSCHADYDIFGVIGADYGLADFKSQFEKACNLFHIQPDGAPFRRGKSPSSSVHAAAAVPREADYTAFFDQAHSHIKETDYLSRRGLNEDIADRFRLGFVKEWRHPKARGNVPATPRLIIPTGRGSYLARDTRADLTEKEAQYSKMKVGPIQLFNLDALKADEPPFIVEGEIDALSIESLGHPAIALGTTSKVKAFVEYVGEAARRLNQPLILALDADESGAKAMDELAGGLNERHIPFYRPVALYAHGKDANENLLHDAAEFAEVLETAQNEAVNRYEEQQEEAQKDYEKISAASFLADFIGGIKGRANTPAIDTGFEALNRTLDGGLFEGLYVIGAISSLGKTTFVLQVADQIARTGQDVLIFSLEMARTELMAKSISRLTYELTIQNGGDERNAKTARGITTGSRWQNYSQTELQLIGDAVSSYAEYARHIFIFEGIGNIGAAQIRKNVEKHISVTGRRPVVVIDYLQILAPYDVRATDKQNTDKAVLELKRISRDYKLPILAISSFNRENYKNAVGMQSFKESGAIEYSSDVLIGLQLEGAGDDSFDATAAKRKNPRDIELVVLKNRNGRVGDKIKYQYYSMFNFFHENGQKMDEEKKTKKMI